MRNKSDSWRSLFCPLWKKSFSHLKIEFIKILLSQILHFPTQYHPKKLNSFTFKQNTRVACHNLRLLSTVHSRDRWCKKVHYFPSSFYYAHNGSMSNAQWKVHERKYGYSPSLDLTQCTRLLFLTAVLDALLTLSSFKASEHYHSKTPETFSLIQCQNA